MNKYINIEVDSKGGVNIDAVGYKGSSCEEATKAIEQALGGSAKKKRKPEYLQNEYKFSRNRVENRR